MPQLQSKKAMQRLRVLSEAARDVQNLIRESLDAGEVFILNQTQLDALNGALRVLDIRNEYFVGDKLRLAFGVEVETAKKRGR